MTPTGFIPRVGTALPNEDSYGEVVKGTWTMLRAFGWDLGKFYDDRLRTEIGPDWFEALVKLRRQEFPNVPAYKGKVNLWDPAFGVNEPAHNDNSPLRALVAPRLSAWEWGRFKRIPSHFRNREGHFDEVPALEALKEDAELILEVSGPLGLQVASEAKELIVRVCEIKAGQDFSGVSRDVVAELDKELVQYQEQLKNQATEYLRLRLEGKAAAVDAARKAHELAVLKETITGLESALAAQRNNKRRTFNEEHVDLCAGDAWPSAPPTRTLRLLGNVVDLYDPVAVDLLSSEYGEIAVWAAERWREFLPYGGTIHLSPAGQAVALVNGTWTYLGSLDDGVENQLGIAG